MNDKNTKNLITSFPKLYSNYHANYQPERQIPFEFQCDDGWFDLIWDLSVKLEAEIIELEAKNEKAPSAVQVKEKYATLRFYMAQGKTSKMSAAIREAEDRSAKTCEICGEPGELRNGDYLLTLCQQHYQERIKK